VKQPSAILTNVFRSRAAYISKRKGDGGAAPDGAIRIMKPSSQSSVSRGVGERKPVNMQPFALDSTAMWLDLLGSRSADRGKCRPGTSGTARVARGFARSHFDRYFLAP